MVAALSRTDRDKDHYFELARLYNYAGRRREALAVLDAMTIALSGETTDKPGNRWHLRSSQSAADYISHLSPYLRQRPTAPPRPTPHHKRPKGVVVYLCCGDDEEFEELHHSLSSLNRHFARLYGSYPVVVFHEGLNETAKASLQTSAGEDMPLTFEHVVFSFPPSVDVERVPPTLHLAGHKWSVGYRHMSHFFCSTMYSLDILQPYEMYWRLDADSMLLDDIPFDVFAEMNRKGWSYGYATVTREAKEVVEGLWNVTQTYIRDQNISPQFLSQHVDNNGDWNLDMYYTNFELSRFDFWRSEEYKSFFEHIER
mmetsp:Transcript_21667/g.51566  ORF Transcript_21667/g.51566 Transcript_21667/m.51566 type:complete len:313 (+) Transcript_21667:38-976(+)